MNAQKLEDLIRSVNLKVTPQRLAVMRALQKASHPTAEQLIEVVRKKYPAISSGTIYHILDTYVEKGLITKVYTHGDVMRYDAILKKHHHLHDTGTNEIKDYFDDELFLVIKKHLRKKKIPDFHLTGIKIKLMGKFITKPNDNEH